MRGTALLGLVAIFLVVQQAPAVPKELPTGPVAIMTPRGHILVLRGVDARQFVNDVNSLQCNKSCDSPEAAARVADDPHSGATSDRYLIAFKGWGGGADFNWTAAHWFYPSTKEEPPYFVWPIGVGDERGAWSEWQEATPRMERLVVGASSSSALPFTGPSLPFQVLTALGFLIAIFGVLLIALSSRTFPHEVAAQRSENDRVADPKRL